MACLPCFPHLRAWTQNAAHAGVERFYFILLGSCIARITIVFEGHWEGHFRYQGEKYLVNTIDK